MRWIAILIVLLAATVAHGDELRGKVVSIADGDTITILDTTKVQHQSDFKGSTLPRRSRRLEPRAKTP